MGTLIGSRSINIRLQLFALICVPFVLNNLVRVSSRTPFGLVKTSSGSATRTLSLARRDLERYRDACMDVWKVSARGRRRRPPSTPKRVSKEQLDGVKAVVRTVTPVHRTLSRVYHG